MNNKVLTKNDFKFCDYCYLIIKHLLEQGKTKEEILKCLKDL